MSVGCSLIEVVLGTKVLFRKCLSWAGQVHYDSILQSDLHFSEWRGGSLFTLSSQHAPASHTTTTRTPPPPLTYHYPNFTPYLPLPIFLPTPAIILPFPVTMPTTTPIPPLLLLLLPSYHYSSPPTPTPHLLPLLPPPTPTPSPYPYSLPFFPLQHVQPSIDRSWNRIRVYFSLPPPPPPPPSPFVICSLAFFSQKRRGSDRIVLTFCSLHGR